ncbi:MAG: tetratricopeptide repeat protein [Desulfobacterales bacterium]|nr:tetratricopeptide repeat protein [Desulfobacterales bacterium]
MYKIRFAGIGFALLIFSMVACTANLEVRKKQEEASRNLAEVYMRQGNYTAALNELLKAEKVYPKDPYLHNDLGLTYMAKGKTDSAINHFLKAIKIKPDYAPVQNNLGTAYLAQKNWDAAISVFKGLVGNLLYVTPHYPLSNLGWAYFNKKDYPTAEQYYLQALEIEPKFSIALRGLGQTYIAMDRISEAIATLEKTVQYAPAFAEAYFDLADAYLISQDHKKAYFAYKKVLELKPDSPLARKAANEIDKINNRFLLK